MIIGLCGGEFPVSREFLAQVLPGARFVSFGPDGTIPDDLNGQGLTPAVDVLVPTTGTVSAALMDAVRPRLIQQLGVGLQGVDMTAAAKRGIPVANIPAGNTGNALAVSELVFMHLLMLLRKYPQTQDVVRNSRLLEPAGNTLDGKVVTVLGTGAIGENVIRRLHAFGAIPLGVGRRAHPELPAGLLPADRYWNASQLIKPLSRSDALVVCVPLTPDTEGMVGSAELEAMPQGGYLVNVGRGPVVDYDALRDAMLSGHLAGAGLDVTWTEPIDPDDPILKENVIITPHIGGVTVESYSKMAAAFAANVHRILGD